MVIKKDLFEIPSVNFSHGIALRGIKMGQPICAEHYGNGQSRKQWWVRCLDAGHNPYVSVHEDTIEESVYEIDEDGDKVRTGTKTKIKVREEYNIIQVPLDLGINSGRGPEDGEKQKGFKNLEEIGVKPVCQLWDCWQPVKIRSPYGDYCSIQHARMIAAHQDGVAVEVLDRGKRRRQLASVDVTQ